MASSSKCRPWLLSNRQPSSLGSCPRDGSMKVKLLRVPAGTVMTKDTAISPGTVSKILWHFTGGPRWNQAAKRQNTTRKPPAEAYANLTSILRTKSLRLGGYKEVVNVVLPAYRKINPATRKVEVEKNVPITLESSPFCCGSHIPAPHLHYHPPKNGKFAVGFPRNTS